MRNWMKVLYWAVAGSFVGVGLIGILSIGYPFLILGLIMIAFGMIKVGTRHAWASLVGFGVVPVMFLSASVVEVFFFSDPSCSGIFWGNSVSASGSVAPGQESITCVQVPGSYLIMLAIFSAIVLFGLIWRFFRGSPA
ncbi:hypothetical protein BH23ACT11_BH23ACT11_11670 [soil metagenome]